MPSESIRQGLGKDALVIHHAYLIAGEREASLSDVLAFLDEVAKADYRHNPDVFIQKFDSFTIDDSRKVKDVASRRALGVRKAIILAFNSATAEAQNALLKALEEPAERTHFFLIVPRADALLATVRSRLFVIEGAHAATASANEAARTFLAASEKVRLAEAKALADSISDGEREKQEAIELVSALEALLWSVREKHAVPASVFDDLSMCRNYLGDRSASVKMLLEHLALVLPQVKI